MFRYVLLLAFIMCQPSIAQKPDETRVVLITLDGLRWQELFSGADPALIGNSEYVEDSLGLRQKFWDDHPMVRRKKLFPFLWQHVASMGQLHGNRDKGSKVNLSNTHWFSYPGYSEILTGKADDSRIDSNDKINNPNVTVLERLKNAGKEVAAFGSWDVFPYIINEERSGVPVNAGFEKADMLPLSEREEFLNTLQDKIPSPWGTVRHDAFTHHYALEHMKKAQPDMVYIAYGETDDFAHDGDYQAYLNSAHTTDAMIRELWEYTQGDPFYKDRTLFLITTDHGRGTDPLHSWTSHGNAVKGAGEVWLIAFGKGVAASGEAKIREQLYSTQLAPTIIQAFSLDVPPSLTSPSLTLGEQD